MDNVRLKFGSPFVGIKFCIYFLVRYVRRFNFNLSYNIHNSILVLLDYDVYLNRINFSYSVV